MPIPKGITVADVDEAIRDFEAGVPHPYRSSTKYDLVLSDGRRLPPKAIVGLAARRLNDGAPLDPERDFSGGVDRYAANRVLTDLGYDVQPKAVGIVDGDSPSWDIAVGETVVRRRDIHGGGGHPLKYGGAWYGGIEPSGTTPNVMIFSEPEAGALYGYNFDGWAADGTLHYTGEGKRGDQRMVEGNKAIALHRDQGRALRVFRARPPEATYLGEFEIDPREPILWTDAPDLDGNVRQVVVFRLKPVGPFERGALPDAPAIGAAGTDDIPAEPFAPVAADVPTEGNAAVTYTVEPSAEPVEYQRREAALVDRYKKWLDNAKHSYGRKRITIPDEAGRLYTDLHDLDRNELIEAKASSARVSIRAGLGQLLDYARFVTHDTKALLVPTRPRPDLLTLLHEHGCGCIWEAEAGKFDRSDPPVVARRRDK